jgi:hypothetical protein
MKKSLIFILSLFALFSVINLVSAQYYSYGPSNFFFSDTINRVISIVQDILGPVFAVLLGDGSIDQYFFSRILLLFIVFTVVFVVLKKIEIFKDNKAVIFIVSAAISILGARFISESELIQGILLPYGALSVALTIFLPFLIYFYFVHTSVPSGIGRKLAWIIFGAVFFGLWWTRYDTMAESNWIYWLGILGIAISFIFDNTIHEYFGISQSNKSRRAMHQQQLAEVESKLQQYLAIQSPSRTTLDVIKQLDKRRAYLAKKAF